MAFYNRRVLQQRTLKSLTRAVGVGLHSGQRVELTLRPAQPDTGIVFRRVDLPQPVDIVVSASAVSDTRLASTLSAGNAKVSTVEHLMSACAGLGVDNLYVGRPRRSPFWTVRPHRLYFCFKVPVLNCKTRPAVSSG